MKLNKKKIQKEYAQKSIKEYFSLIKNINFKKYHLNYIKEILKLTQTFNIRLKREEKLKFCKKCLTPQNKNSKKIRINSKIKCIEHICLNCKETRRFRYK